ncbi:MAG TPA: hypothetical protein VMK83_11320 [Gaiellaceae bacterium]|nr:hypothetical protein [Gaiellaceae bacterium]
MTVRALLGLVVFNAFLLVVGVAVLGALRGWRSWSDLVRCSGLAYFLGVALVGVALTVELVMGVPFSMATILLTGLGLVAVALVLRAPLTAWHPSPSPDRVRGLGFVTFAFGLLVVVCLEALFRAGRLAGLSAWDAWAFWVPKAKAIYFFGGLDEQFFRELVNPTYPPLVPALEAAAFHFMGSADVVTLHVQFWFFACGFAAAVAGLLAPRVTPILLWPFLLLVLVAPRVAGRNLDPQADFLLDYFFALAALLLALWLVEREPWLLAAACPLMAAALLTKREGLMLVACLVVAALVGSWRHRGHAWPRLGLVAGIAVVAAIPWRVWFSSRDLTGELPSAGVLGIFDDADRAWPALASALSALFDYDLWLVIVPLAVAAVILGYLSGARVLPTFALTLYALTTAGVTWVLWAFTELELPFEQDEGVNPIVRLSGSLVVASAALVPLLVDAAWRGADAAEELP